MSEGSNIPVRLGKAAREFNVGTNTIVDFLSKKGYQVDPSPNTKLSPEMYSLLVKEYQSEKIVKEEAQKLGIEFSGRKTVSADTIVSNQINKTDEDEDDINTRDLIIKNVTVDFDSRNKKTTSSVNTPKEEVETPKVSVTEETPKEQEIIAEQKDETPSKEEAKTDILQKEENDVAEKAEKQKKVHKEKKQKTEDKPVEETPVETTVEPIVETTVEPIVETIVEPIVEPIVETVAQPAVETKEETVEQIVESKEKPEVDNSKEEDVVVAEDNKQSSDFNLKVVGKIDLDSINMRTKPDRKSKAEKQKETQAKRDAREKEKSDKKKSLDEQRNKPSQGTQNQQQQQQQTKPVVEKEKTVETPHKQEDGKPANFLRTEVRKLEGPKILDKIVLPEQRKPKPIASSSENKIGAAQKKKKRKRIDKPQTGAPGTTNTPPATQNKDNQGGERRQGGGGQQQQQQQRSNDRFAKKGKPAPRHEEKVELTEEEIQRQIKETLARLTPLRKSKTSKHRREKRDAISHSMAEEMARHEQEKTLLKVTEFVTANELATMMNVPVTKVIATCMSLGLFVSINQRLDAETLALVAEEFGFQLEFTSIDIQEALAENEEVDNPEDLVERAPIVTVMGHVDHGKTLLLDFIRKSNVTAGEAGGITQHIGAYEVFNEKGRKITFLDTPGHEAFTAMRARGAKMTDVVIIVIAADDSVMPQTVEAINHAQAAGVPIVFAINKIDKPTAHPEKIREQLANMNILVEDWGGKYQCQEVSAKSGVGIEQLLEKVLLEAEILELKGNPKKPAKGTVIESALDKGRGYVAKILVQDGTLRIGDIIIAGSTHGKVKAMFNERNKAIKEAGPSTPLLLLGLSGAPQAGDVFNVLHDEREAKSIAAKRQQLQRELGLRTQVHITLDEIGRRIALGDFKELNIIVKGDVDGSIEALSDSLLKLSTEEVQVNVIHKSVGAISESDIMLASASNAVIVGFQVRPTMQARKLAENEKIDIRLYSIIYQAIEEIKSAIEGMLAPEIQEVITCNIEIREVFKVSKVGTIAGCMVLDGKITRNTRIRIIRDGIVIYSGVLGSLKRFKDDVKEVNAGYECGLNVENFNDIKVGDIIEGYQEQEISRKL